MNDVPSAPLYTNPVQYLATAEGSSCSWSVISGAVTLMLRYLIPPDSPPPRGSESSDTREPPVIECGNSNEASNARRLREMETDSVLRRAIGNGDRATAAAAG